MVDERLIHAYLTRLFGWVDWQPEHCVVIRGIGEKGAGNEDFRYDDVWTPARAREQDVDPVDHLARVVATHARRWADHGIATFVLPAVLNMPPDGRKPGRTEDVVFTMAAILDLDQGPTAQRAKHLAGLGLSPSFWVLSGGTTDAGDPKAHGYWVFNEPSNDIAAGTRIRELLASKLGGDIAVSRPHQPIRVPGTVHGKGGTHRLVTLSVDRESRHPSEIPGAELPTFEPSDLEERLVEMPAAPGVEPFKPKVAGGTATLGRMLPLAGETGHAEIGDALEGEIHEGGGPDGNRWSRFNQVAGHYLAEARTGVTTLEAARELAYGWMHSRMRPAWDDARFEREWAGLQAREAENAARTAQPPASAPFGQPTAALPFPAHGSQPTAPSQGQITRGILKWSVESYTQGQPKPVTWLVEGLIGAGWPHLFVAQGGAGKTFQLLDLGLKVACGLPGDNLSWFGRPIKTHGRVAVLTTEDDAEELHRRMALLDPGGRRLQPELAQRLFVMPTVDAGGSFPLMERSPSGMPRLTREWGSTLDELASVPDLQLVVIDTFNSTHHEEENSATAIAEYVRGLAPLLGGAVGNGRKIAVVITHHVRKRGKDPVGNRYDMLDAVRGSSALLGNFRQVIGMWEAPGWHQRMAGMGLQPRPNGLWVGAVIKSNNPASWRDDITLLMPPEGGAMIDMTAHDPVRRKSGQLHIWLQAAVSIAARRGFPYTKTRGAGIFANRGQLPPLLRDLSRHRLERLVEEMLSENQLVTAKDGESKAQWLDVPGGVLADPDRAAKINRKLGAYEPPDWSRFHYDDHAGRLQWAGTGVDPRQERPAFEDDEASAGDE